MLVPSIIERIPFSARAKLVTVMPKILQPALKFTPFSVQKKLLLLALESVFREALEDGDFEFLTGKWLGITIKDLSLTWLISFENKQLIMAPENTAIEQDVKFSASSEDLLLIAGRKEDPDTLFFQRRLKIEGDTELGLEVKNLIDAVDISQLPSLVHQIVDACASFIQSSKRV